MNKNIKVGMYVFLGRGKQSNDYIRLHGKVHEILEYPFKWDHDDEIRIRFGDVESNQTTDMPIVFDSPDRSDYLTHIIDFSDISIEDKSKYITILNSDDLEAHEYVIEVLKEKNCIVL